MMKSHDGRTGGHEKPECWTRDAHSLSVPHGSDLDSHKIEEENSVQAA